MTKQQVVIELEGRTYEEQLRNLRNLICSLGEWQLEHGGSGKYWPSYFRVSDEGLVKQLPALKPCPLCGAKPHSGPCYVFPL